jgi:hypothetical protein
MTNVTPDPDSVELTPETTNAPPLNDTYVAPPAYASAYQPPVYGQQPYGQFQPYSNVPGYMNPPTNVLAVVGFIMSLVPFVWPLGSIAGVIMGHIALAQLKREQKKGHGLALAAVIIGYVGIGLFVLLILFAILGALVDPSGYSDTTTSGLNT